MQKTVGTYGKSISMTTLLAKAQAKLSDASNTKLGRLIHGWSIPAGRDKTCPGASVLCHGRCYARSGFFRMPNVRSVHDRNYDFSLTDQFEDWMRAVVVTNFVQIMRIHVSGDFYDLAYTQKWFRILSQLPRTRFFAYTRSWRDESIFPELVKIAGLSNVSLWFSIDRETGPAPLVRGVRRAYMAISDVDAENAPDDCDLVFRDDPVTIMKKANGVQVCPPENGVTTQFKITCSHCGICWNKQQTQWETDLLPLLDTSEINAPEDF